MKKYWEDLKQNSYYYLYRKWNWKKHYSSFCGRGSWCSGYWY